MRRLDRAKTAALSLTGVVVATAIGVAVTAAARTPDPQSAAGDRAIALVSPRATSTPLDEASPPVAPSGTGNDGPGNGTTSGSSGPGDGKSAGAGSSALGRARAAVAVAGDTRGDGTPEDPPGSPPGDTRGDGTPEDGDTDNDNDDDSDDEYHGGRRHGGKDDGEKDNSGPGNYENPGRSNSGGDDDD